MSKSRKLSKKNIVEDESEVESSEEEVDLKRKRYIQDEVEEDDVDEEADDYAGVDLKEKEELQRMKAYYEQTNNKQTYQQKLDEMEQRAKAEEYGVKREATYNEYEEEEELYEDEAQPAGAYMPSVTDPKLWLLKCAKNHEREIAVALLHKYFDLYDSDGKLMISAVVSSDKLKGYLYVESRKEQYVLDAVKDVQLLYRSKPFLVPLNDMVSIMRVDEAKLEDIREGQWVRVTKGLYKNDLAQVYKIEEHRTKVMLKILPRLDDNLEHDDDDTDLRRKRHFSSNRPIQRPFNKHDYVTETYQKYGETFHMYNKKLFRNSLLYKQVNIKAIQIHNINPTNEECKMYATLRNEDNEELYSVDSILSSINEVVGAKHVYSQGERVEVVLGDLKGLVGLVQSCKPDGSSVAVKPTNAKDFDDVIEVESAWVTKKFNVGDNVVVLDGMHTGMAGIVMSVDKYLVEVLSHDLSKRVKAKGINLMLGTSRSALSQLDQRNNFSNKYSIHDLVAFKSKEDSNKYDTGVVIQVEKNYLKLMLNENIIENIPYNQIVQKIPNNNKYAATDKNTNSLNVGDTVKILDGFYKGYQGSIKHIFKNIVWVNSMDQTDNLGYVALNSKRLIKSGYGAIKGYVHSTPNTREKTKHSNYVIIKKGPFKSHKGFIKKVINGNKFIVELTSKAKITTLREGEFDIVLPDGAQDEQPLHLFPGEQHSQALKTPAYVPHSSNTMQSPGMTPSGGDNPFRHNHSNANSPSRSHILDEKNSNTKFTPHTDQPYNFSPSRDSKKD